MSRPPSSDDVAASTPTPDPSPADTIGHFTILEQIGRGGMGRVYVAYDAHLDRRVALKLVAPDREGGSSSGAAQRRLLREAQAMARLAHPNVVQVFEAGEWQGGIWLAMELVEGGTLRTWLARDKSRRDWRTILDMHIAAGRGLVAAHAAGLVHRDFKPENVLVGSDGRPRVADFGLVRPDSEISRDGASIELPPHADVNLQTGDSLSVASSETVSLVVDPSEADPGMGARVDPNVDSWQGSLDSTGLMAPMTRAGALLGTPRYMAPEQLLRQGADARSDQFAFCVTLYAALYGRAPFAGKSLFELTESVTSGQLRPPPRDSPVPRRVTRALLRGLSTDPDDRFPDMESLLAALAPAEPKRWIVAGVVGALLIAVAVLAGLQLADSSPELCRNGAERVSPTWGDARREQLRAHFDGSELAFAESTAERVIAELDVWSAAWVGAYADACEATHVRGEQSSQALDLRMRCLERERREAGAIVDILTHADAETIEHAADVLRALPDLEVCADVEQLRRRVDPPSPAVVDEVHRLEGELAQAESLLDASLLAKAVERTEALGPAIAVTEYPPLIARYDLVRAWIELDRGKPDAASELALQTYTRAIEADDQELALVASHALLAAEGGVSEVGQALGARWFAIGLALERRVQPSADLRVDLRVLYAKAMAWEEGGATSLALLHEALELAEDAFGPDALETVDVRLSLGATLSEWGEYTAGERQLELARSAVERELGPDHPRLAPALRMLGTAVGYRGDTALAVEHFERAHELLARHHGPSNPDSIEALTRLAAAYDLAGERDKARAGHEQILALLGERERPRTQNGVDAANSLCFELYKDGELDQAQTLCQATLMAADEVYGVDHPFTGIVHNNLGLIARAQGDPTTGLEHDRIALALQTERFGDEHPFTAYALIGIGESLLDLGRSKEAEGPLSRALGIWRVTEAPGQIGEARCLLARAQFGARSTTRAHAIAELDRAIAELESGGADWDATRERCTEARDALAR